MSIAKLLVTAGTLYLEVGFAVALVFAAYGVSRLEPSARGASLLFRVIIVPGATLLWPVIALRTARALYRMRGVS